METNLGAKLFGSSIIMPRMLETKVVKNVNSKIKRWMAGEYKKHKKSCFLSKFCMISVVVIYKLKISRN